jgi:iron complex outermembrane receptor protein/vitamin B12 transporter
LRFTKPSIFTCLGYLTLATTFSTFASSALESTANQTVEVFTVTGSKLPNASFAAHTILTRPTIEALNPISTTQLLRSIPGIVVSENSNGAGQSFVSIRGGESNFTLVMIDGVIVNDPTNSRGGGFNFNQLDPSAIERVEVYRGGISAIYGSDAISGVIQFITRKSANTALQVVIGDNRQKQANAITSYSFSDQVSGLLNASIIKREDSSEESFTSKQILMNLTAGFENFQHSAFFSYVDRNSKSFAEDSGGILFANPYSAEQRDNKLFIIGLQSSYIPDDVNFLQQIKAKISWHSHKEASMNPGISDGVLSGIPSSNIISDYKKWSGELYGVWQLSPQWEMVIGTSAQQAVGKNDGTLDFGFPLPVDFSLSQDIYSIFGEINGNIGDINLNIGVRSENPTDFNSDVASRLGISKRFSESLTVHSSFSQGYKLPSFFALAHPLVGNANLKPEESDNFELGFDMEMSKYTNIQLNYFYNEYKNLVDFDPELFQSVNRQSVTAKGIEWQITSDLTSWLSLQFDLTYLDNQVNTENEEKITLRRRSKWQGGGFIKVKLQDFTTTLSADSRSSFTDSAIPTGELELGGFTQLNLSNNWLYSKNLTLILTVDNLLDKKYQESIGFASTGIGYRLGLRYQFK